MHKRQLNRQQYFNELSITSSRYFIPYISQYLELNEDVSVLEIGCGDGGNLLPFARKGCNTVGVDIAGVRIDDAITFFKEAKAKGKFIEADIFEIKEFEYSFDLIICHDVFEHIENKALFLSNLRRYLRPNGIVFIAFPAWQMPFGGHQQICKNKVVSRLPFIHLLPNFIYKRILNFDGKNERCVSELLEIKKTRVTIELFERLVKKEEVEIIDKVFYFINPHYEVKFGLRPRKLLPFIGAVPYLRNFFITSCFYLLRF